MYEWSSLTDAVINVFSLLGELPSTIPEGELDSIYHAWFRAENIMEFRDSFAMMRDVPSIFD
jgi:hypothetical protein